MALNQIKRQLLTTPIPDMKGHLKLVNCDYAITGWVWNGRPRWMDKNIGAIRIFSVPVSLSFSHLWLALIDPLSFINSMNITKVNIPLTSTTPLPQQGLHTVTRNVDVDLKGKWKYNSKSW